MKSQVQTQRAVQFQIPALQITFDDYLAEIEKQRAMRQVEEHAAKEWKSYALETVRKVTEARQEFTTDEVLAAMTDAPVWTHELRALGPVMIAAKRAGFIKPTNRFVKSESVSRHHTDKRVWSSNLYSAPKSAAN